MPVTGDHLGKGLGLILVSSESKTSENFLCFLQIEDTVLVMVIQLKQALEIIKFIFGNSKFILTLDKVTRLKENMKIILISPNPL